MKHYPDDATLEAIRNEAASAMVDSPHSMVGTALRTEAFQTWLSALLNPEYGTQKEPPTTGQKLADDWMFGCDAKVNVLELDLRRLEQMIDNALAQNDRALPEIPDGWYIGSLSNGGMATNTPWWKCTLNRISDRSRPSGLGPTPRQAVLNAIAKIGEKDNG